MPFEEKNQWAYGAITVVAFTVYASVILSRAQDTPLTDVPYVWPMLATISAAILAAILASIAIAIASPKEAGKKDERDKEINRRGEYIGQGFVVVGAVGALLLAMLEADYFWIANVVYLCFVLSAVVSTTAKLVAYRRGFVGW
ncbi:MAG: hypothetical protein Q7V58_12920 [Actinomycetota bacterium]|nr:hypothetical protein [Actinomycetota bacterium]